MSDRYTDRLSDYLDEELDESERLEIETHLRECPRAFRRSRSSGSSWPARPASRTATTSRGARSLAGHRGAPRTEAARPPVRPACVRSARSAGSGDRLPRSVLLGAARRGLPGHGGAVGHGGLVRRPRAVGPRLRRADSGLDGRCRVPGGLLAGSQLGRRGRPRRRVASGRDDLDPETIRTLEESLMVIEIAIRARRGAPWTPIREIPMSARTWTRPCAARWSCSTARRCSPARRAEDPHGPRSRRRRRTRIVALAPGADTTFAVSPG